MAAPNRYRFLDPRAVARTKNLALTARGVVEGWLSGLHASPYHGFSVEFAEHREYSPGDDPRHLDYRSLARTDRLFVKQYEDETNMRVQILLDCSGSMGYRHSGPMTKLEYAQHIAAVLAYLLTRQQDAVGLSAFDRTLRLDIPPGSTPRHFHELMQRLEQIEPGEPTDIADTLHRMASRLKRRGLIILLSDLYDDTERRGDDTDAVIRALHHFRHRRHEVILFHVLDRAEIEFPFDDLTGFTDLETGRRIEIDPAYAADAYRRAFQRFVDRYRRACAEARVDYIQADTSTPHDEFLARCLRSRR